jgi:hypothetical protein
MANADGVEKDRVPGVTPMGLLVLKTKHCDRKKAVADFTCCGYYATATREERVSFSLQRKRNLYVSLSSAVVHVLDTYVGVKGALALFVVLLYRLKRYEPDVYTVAYIQ